VADDEVELGVSALDADARVPLYPDVVGWEDHA